MASMGVPRRTPCLSGLGPLAQAAVQSSLPAKRKQNRIDVLLSDDAFNDSGSTATDNRSAMSLLVWMVRIGSTRTV
jgi:hypothetical protein